MYIQDTFEQLSQDSFEQLPAYYLNGLNLESTIFFNLESIFIKETFISHSKNVERQRKEKADESALTKIIPI